VLPHHITIYDKSMPLNHAFVLVLKLYVLFYKSLLETTGDY